MANCCCTLLLCCLKNISVTKAAKTLVAFFTFFGIAFSYLNWSSFTLWTTALWVSILLSTIFTVGVSSSVYLRCAAVLFVVQCFSRFGLFMVFISLSWLTLQAGIGSFLSNHRVSYSVLGGESTEENKFDVNIAGGVLGVLHYSVIVPFLCTYIYAVLYEITYETRRIIKRSSKRSKDKKLKRVCLDAIIDIYDRSVMFIIGGVFASTLMWFWVQRMNYENLVLALKSTKKDYRELQDMSTFWFAFYLISCAVLFVLVPFSKYVMKFRHVIIKNFFKKGDSKGTVSCRGDHIYFAKPKNSRIPLKVFKKELNAREKPEESTKKEETNILVETPKKEKRQREQKTLMSDCSTSSGEEVVAKIVKMPFNDKVNYESTSDEDEIAKKEKFCHHTNDRYNQRENKRNSGSSSDDDEKFYGEP